MSQELFGEASKRRNKKQEEKRKLIRKNGRELFDNKLYSINLFPLRKKSLRAEMTSFKNIKYVGIQFL